MGILDIFSKRQRHKRGEMPDVYQYDNIPTELRIQLAHIFRDAIGKDGISSHLASRFVTSIHDALTREYGVYVLTPMAVARGHADPVEDVHRFLVEEKDTEKTMDAIELFLKAGPARWIRHVRQPGVRVRAAFRAVVRILCFERRKYWLVAVVGHAGHQSGVHRCRHGRLVDHRKRFHARCHQRQRPRL